MKKLMVFLLGLFLLTGCGPTLLKQREIPPLDFDPTAPYSIDLSNIPKPDKLKPIFMDSEFKEVSKDQAVYIVLIPQEYAKVAAMVKLAKAYKSIVKEQGILINTNIEIINSLKEYVALERAKAEEYRRLWVDSENALRQAQYRHKLDQAITRGTFGAIALGALLALIIAL